MLNWHHLVLTGLYPPDGLVNFAGEESDIDPTNSMPIVKKNPSKILSHQLALLD